jgi:solute carrier family 25 thiamine pyrophosphate transporter 19
MSGGGGTESLSGSQHFLCGFSAGLFAKLCCHPLDVVKKRFQVQGLNRHPRYGAGIQEREYKNIWDAIQTILAKEGWRGLYKGTLPSVVKAAPAAAITFVVYEAVLNRLTSLAA